MSRNIKRWCAVATLAALVSAQACEARSGLNLRYQALATQRGTFWLEVRCAPGDAPYRLSLAPGTLTGSDWSLRLQGSQATLNVLVRGVYPAIGDALRGGAVLSGDQVFTFEAVALAGQWVPQGQYTSQVTLTLQGVDHP